MGRNCWTFFQYQTSWGFEMKKRQHRRLDTHHAQHQFHFCTLLPKLWIKIKREKFMQDSFFFFSSVGILSKPAMFARLDKAILYVLSNIKIQAILPSVSTILTHISGSIDTYIHSRKKLRLWIRARAYSLLNET